MVIYESATRAIPSHVCYLHEAEVLLVAPPDVMAGCPSYVAMRYLIHEGMRRMGEQTPSRVTERFIQMRLTSSLFLVKEWKPPSN